MQIRQGTYISRPQTSRNSSSVLRRRHWNPISLSSVARPWVSIPAALNEVLPHRGRKMRVSYPRINELIHGKRGVTPDTALRLEQLFGMEAQFWLNLQLAWDLYHATHSPAAKEIRKIKCLIPGAKKIGRPLSAPYRCPLRCRRREDMAVLNNMLSILYSSCREGIAHPV